MKYCSLICLNENDEFFHFKFFLRQSFFLKVKNCYQFVMWTSHIYSHEAKDSSQKKIQFKVRTNQLHVPKTHTKINLISPTSQEQIYFLLKDYDTTFQMWSSTSFPANKSIWFKCNCVTRMTVNMTVGMKMREAIKCLHKNTIDGSNSTHESTSV